ncbi:hypothetical protein BJ912DRAFT_187767 [Pholiota molesta]|nr:hypothetical protein BJ912DRAFT_187767 [Pholiota molesta]
MSPLAPSSSSLLGSSFSGLCLCLASLFSTVPGSVLSHSRYVEGHGSTHSYCLFAGLSICHLWNSVKILRSQAAGPRGSGRCPHVRDYGELSFLVHRDLLGRGTSV